MTLVYKDMDGDWLVDYKCTRDQIFIISIPEENIVSWHDNPRTARREVERLRKPLSLRNCKKCKNLFYTISRKDKNANICSKIADEINDFTDCRHCCNYMEV